MTKKAKSSGRVPAKTAGTKKKVSPAASAALVTENADKPTGNKSTMSSLHRWNKWLAIIHLVQGLVILLLSITKTFPLTIGFLTADPLQGEGASTLVSATRQVGDVNLAYLVASFFFVSALAHGLIATVYRRRYEADLAAGINRARWIEYAVSAGIMIVAIGVLVGIYDVASLLMLFALTAIMNLLGLVMELRNKKAASPDWLSYVIGCVAGAVPWIIIALYLVGGAMYGSAAPVFVYFIFASIFLLFMSFAVNMYLQYARIGKWQDYLYGERVYMILSLVAKSALAWQVFAGALQP